VAKKSIEKYVKKLSKRNDDSKNCSEEFNLLKDDHETDCGQGLLVYPQV
jgi:hypothetical protein